MENATVLSLLQSKQVGAVFGWKHPCVGVMLGAGLLLLLDVLGSSSVFQCAHSREKAGEFSRSSDGAGEGPELARISFFLAPEELDMGTPGDTPTFS